MPVPGDPGTGPDRQRQGTMGHKVEAGTECLRHHLRRKNQLNANRGSTVKRTLPAQRTNAFWGYPQIVNSYSGARAW
jgi:hypothetical protein